jgi:hypothetical protein
MRGSDATAPLGTAAKRTGLQLGKLASTAESTASMDGIISLKAARRSVVSYALYERLKFLVRQATPLFMPCRCAHTTALSQRCPTLPD